MPRFDVLFVILIVLILVLLLQLVIVLIEIFVKIVIKMKTIRDDSCEAKTGHHDAGSTAGLAFSRFGGGYVDQKWRPQRGQTQN